ncbi:hypothetical protein JQ616_05570 [Bradyrhizobium tropiciagri]|uniref:hypothetical protein n=1 Tax=Bradyrhizobium tropiciagri TaxID=312253 RepID=UPI001BA4952B|nr:hypothetical protein [Bradyrhizobium tropiciagri]MBR0894412.1 hypothetical protein [Bradyrhizobium tropiciagri]
MKIVSLLHSLAAIWYGLALLSAVPAIIVGAVIGWTLQRWYICLIVSALAAFGFMYAFDASRPIRPNHPLSLIELAGLSAATAFPIMLIATSVGYFVVRRLSQWRRKRRAPST